MRRLSLISCCAFLALVCASASPQASQAQPDYNPWRFDVNERRLQTAEQFLSELCLQPSEYPLTVRVMSNWLRMSDLPALIARAEDDTPCNAVISAYSSFIGHDFSTVGREAKFLILGLRVCSYPPALSSLRTPEKQLDDALRWGKLMVARGEKDFCAPKPGG
jgi:hypothetical protein